MTEGIEFDDFVEREDVRTAFTRDGLPRKIFVLDETSGLVGLYVPRLKAKRVSVPRESHVALGHYECGACGTIVGAHDRYCRMCGADIAR